MLKNIISFGIYLIVFSLPLYLLKVKILGIPFTVSELMVYGVFALCLFQKVQCFRPPNFLKKLKETGYFYPILLIFAGFTISTLFSSDIQTSAGIWKSWLISPLLFFIIFIDIIKDRTQIKKSLIASTLSGAGVALISLWHWFSGDLTFDGRLKAFYLSPNHLAMYLAPILILSLALWQFAKNKYQKILLVTGYWLLVVIIYLTYSYGAWLGLIGAGVFIFLSLRATPKKFFLLCFLIILLFILIFSQFQTQKAQNLFNFSRSSLESRLMIWRTAVEIIKDQSLIGIGPGMFQKYYLKYQSEFGPYLEWAAPQPHNLFLAFWLQTGLIGLIGFIWLLFLFFRTNFKRLRITRYPLRITLIAAMIYILIHGLVDATYWKNDLSMIFWLIMALSYTTIHLSYSRKTNNLLEEKEKFL
ncbi:MAG: hypothetical protein A2815_00135 [Candidatus Portnoybacteria bacterium RIFCSPHIGHO2_01_FULL_40_12b]|uniref:O-antigen ligase-related domain-containing protein n=1 Tax=Candidatus Portnoybacteria bacterium RIFCSPHIGHO2_01_FULL_40_12b TaxID=1801994 RepID=A0A1G2FD78_9BACT|nr:MAG: hypothetical protein A2815_00135 [Candidatus Portnoybacteria bacterium RIFCSPHIGHO2_01_FULL_40_12b]